jgi:hypothetical protein
MKPEAGPHPCNIPVALESRSLVKKQERTHLHHTQTAGQDSCTCKCTLPAQISSTRRKWLYAHCCTTRIFNINLINNGDTLKHRPDANTLKIT